MTSNHRVLEDADISLIERVKLSPALYDPRHGNFRSGKTQEWSKVAGSLFLAPSDARRRWTCLRDRYTRELKQLRLYPDKGEYGKNDFFRLMDFLRRFVKKRRARTRSRAIKGESSWEGSMDDTPLAKSGIIEVDSDVEGVAEQIFDSNAQNSNKSEMHDDATTEYPHVESLSKAESNVPYDGYMQSTFTITTPAILHEQQQQNRRSQDNQQQLPKLKSRPQTPVVEPAIETEEDYYYNSNMLHQQQQQNRHSQDHQQQQLPKQTTRSQTPAVEAVIETEDDYYCKSIAAYLRQLSRRHKIKAKVEMFQILEKYLELEENSAQTCGAHCCNNKNK